MRSTIAALFLLVAARGCPLFAAGHARHVVLVVWDGLRPDLVTEQNTPTLYRLGQEGVVFQHHHSVYPSATEVNGTALATGMYPAHSGLVGNKEYRPQIDERTFIHTEALEAVRRGDAVSHGHYLLASTLPEIVRRAGGRTVVAGAKPVALLFDRVERNETEPGVNLFAGHALPPSLLELITNRYGAYPALGATNPSCSDWATLALVDSLWADGVPEFTYLWLNEPDLTQHRTAPGSGPSLAAMRDADDNLARVLRRLDEKGARAETDVLVASDHGCSTVSRMIDLAALLRAAGFHAGGGFTNAPGPGDVLVAGNSGSSLLYVIGHDKATIEKLVSFLQRSDFAGVIFSRTPEPGTFPLELVHMDSAASPDIVVSFRWNAGVNSNGVPSMIVSDISEYGPGQGAHVSLSRFDMHNTLIAAGPDFRSGIGDVLPSGNVDVAPTVLWILGIKQAMDGRVLSEALTIKGPALTGYEPRRIEMTNAAWHQYLDYSEVNGVRYVDEGNGRRE
jgi:arylsulfatase A-like enzyme